MNDSSEEMIAQCLERTSQLEKQLQAQQKSARRVKHTASGVFALGVLGTFLMGGIALSQSNSFVDCEGAGNEFHKVGGMSCFKHTTPARASEVNWNFKYLYDSIMAIGDSLTVRAIEVDENIGKLSDEASQQHPIGQIVALSPVAPAPDSTRWQLCDGRAIPDGSALGKHLTRGGAPRVTPNLTDDRFLRGGPNDSKTETGGSSDGHSHTVDLTTANPNAGSALASHTHGYKDWRANSEQHEDSNIENGSADPYDSDRMTAAPNDVSHVHRVTGTIGQGLDGSRAGANVPPYQKVVYYIRIN